MAKKRQELVATEELTFEGPPVDVAGPNHFDYQSRGESLRCVAGMWSTYLRTTVTPKQVAICLALLKIIRDGYLYTGCTSDDLYDAYRFLYMAGEVDE